MKSASSRVVWTGLALQIGVHLPSASVSAKSFSSILLPCKSSANTTSTSKKCVHVCVGHGSTKLGPRASSPRPLGQGQRCPLWPFSAPFAKPAAVVPFQKTRLAEPKSAMQKKEKKNRMKEKY